jgi:hypothetical protein
VKTGIWMISALVLLGCESAPTPAASSGSSSAASKPSASAPAKASASASAAPAPSASAAEGECKLVGDWSGKTPPGPTPVNNQDISVHFKDDGKSTWETKITTQEGSWKVDKGELTIANTGNTQVEKGRFQCPKDSEGKYGLTWSGCDTVTFQLKADPCEGRSKVLGGTKLDRKK